MRRWVIQAEYRDKWLGRHESPPREYIVATTHLCSGDDLVRSLVTSLENNLTRL